MINNQDDGRGSKKRNGSVASAATSLGSSWLPDTSISGSKKGFNVLTEKFGPWVRAFGKQISKVEGHEPEFVCVPCYIFSKVFNSTNDGLSAIVPI